MRAVFVGALYLRVFIRKASTSDKNDGKKFGRNNVIKFWRQVSTGSVISDEISLKTFTRCLSLDKKRRYDVSISKGNLNSASFQRIYVMSTLLIICRIVIHHA